MRRLLSIIVFMHVTLLKAQTPINIVKKATAFVYLLNSQGQPAPNGTCFFVGLPSPSNKSGSYVFLVTAKHVLQDEKKKFYKEVLIRLNTSDSSSAFATLPLKPNGSNKNLYVHKDSTVDIAVIPVDLSKMNFAGGYLAEDYIYSRESYKSQPVLEGTEVFFTGLFVPYTGGRRGVPIVRFGKVSLIPDEKIPWVNNQKCELILIETSSYGGNSGSPVYFRIINQGKTFLILGGVLSGTFRDASTVEIVQNSVNNIPIVRYNNGISAISPAYLLHDILNSEEIKAHLK